jgi:hypothetical protein
MRSLRTKSLTEATARRNEFYESLGFTIDQQENGDRYIYWVKPYQVRIQGTFVGSFETFDEAARARDEFLSKPQ